MGRQVLLVEPDLDALGTLAAELRARGLAVELADGVDRALERARRVKPEAILLSAHLVTGDEDLSRLWAEPELSGVHYFVLSDDASEEREGLEALPRQDVEIIVRRMYAIPPRASASVGAEKGDFRGDLEQVSLLDLLQLLGMNRRTGILSVTTSAGAGEVRLNAGEVVDAVYRRLEGEKALFRLLAEREGNFMFTSAAPSSVRRVQAPTGALLMEGMRQLDEVRQRRDSIAADDALLAVELLPDDLPEAAHRVVESLRAPRTVDELLDELPLADLDILAALGTLLERGIVRQVVGGAARMELADSEQMTVLAAFIERLSPAAFAGPPRVVFAASPKRLATLMHALGRIADAVVPAMAAPSTAIPFELSVLRLRENCDLAIVGLPLVDHFVPLWSLALPGAAMIIRLEDACAAALEAAGQRCGVRILEAEELLGELDEADPMQVAALLRAALESSSTA